MLNSLNGKDLNGKIVLGIDLNMYSKNKLEKYLVNKVGAKKELITYINKEFSSHYNDSLKKYIKGKEVDKKYVDILTFLEFSDIFIKGYINGELNSNNINRFFKEDRSYEYIKELTLIIQGAFDVHQIKLTNIKEFAKLDLLKQLINGEIEIEEKFYLYSNLEASMMSEETVTKVDKLLSNYITIIFLVSKKSHFCAKVNLVSKKTRERKQFEDSSI